MALKSVYLPDPAIKEGEIRVTEEEHHHLGVARAAEGETVEVFDGKGGVWTARIVARSRHETVLRVSGERRVAPDPNAVILGLSLIRPSAFELALEKAVEVGVTRIIPVMAARSNVKPGGRKERWRRIAVEAAKQSKRYYVPEVDDAVALESILSCPARSKIVFAERGGGPLQSAVAGPPVLCVIGPEGGWTEAELEKFRRSGFALTGLGDGILRTETAAIVGPALIRYELQSR
jgi:16S rRNA (uracil1498-N3)-methyltransferase